MSKSICRYLMWRVVASGDVGGVANLRAAAVLSGSGSGEAPMFGQDQGVSMVGKDLVENIILNATSVNLLPTIRLISISGGNMTRPTTQRFHFSI